MGRMASELSDARMSVSVSCAWKRLVEVFSVTAVTGRRRANDSRRRDTKDSYHNLSQLDVALPRPSEPRLGERSTTRGTAESLALVSLVVVAASKRSSGARAPSESRAESGRPPRQTRTLNDDAQAATACLGDETTLPRGLR